VRAIRTYRPLVVLNGWSGTPADGHGQHQLAGQLAPLAFAAAADPARYPEQIAEGLRPWQARKLYVRHGFAGDPATATLRLPTGKLDPVLGRSYHEIGIEGRVQQRSQETGAIEARGAKTSNLDLVADLTGRARPAPGIETGVFDGIDTSLAALPALAGLPSGSLATELANMDVSARQALASPYLVRAPARLVPDLATGLTAARAALAAASRLNAPAAARAEAEFLLAIKVAQFEDALLRASGVAVDALADREVAAAGESLGVGVHLFTPEGSTVTAGPSALAAPAGWTSATAAAESDDSERNPFARFFGDQPTRSDRFEVQVAADAGPTTPYWLAAPRTGPVFTWAGVPTALQTQPFQPPLVTARVPLTLGGVEVVVERPVQHRYADPVRGEIRRNVEVVPAVSVAFDEPLAIVPARPPGRARSASACAARRSRRAPARCAWWRRPAGR
jgi:hypothetical protein